MGFSGQNIEVKAMIRLKVVTWAMVDTHIFSGVECLLGFPVQRLGSMVWHIQLRHALIHRKRPDNFNQLITRMFSNRENGGKKKL